MKKKYIIKIWRIRHAHASYFWTNSLVNNVLGMFIRHHLMRDVLIEVKNGLLRQNREEKTIKSKESSNNTM